MFDAIAPLNFHSLWAGGKKVRGLLRNSALGLGDIAQITGMPFDFAALPYRDRIFSEAFTGMINHRGEGFDGRPLRRRSKS